MMDGARDHNLEPTKRALQSEGGAEFQTAPGEAEAEAAQATFLAGATPRPPSAPSRMLRQTAVLRLQASHGNQYVARRLAQRQEDTPAEGAGPPASVVADQGLIVDDSATTTPGQMKKTEFLTEAQTAVNAVVASDVPGPVQDQAASELQAALAPFAVQAGPSLERSLRQQIPGASAVTTARGYIPLLVDQVRQTITQRLSVGGLANMARGAASQVADAAMAGLSSIFFKARPGGPQAPGSPAAVQADLGAGQGLESGVRTGLEAAYGQSFGQVRVHTDTRAADLSDRFNARAFTVGQDIAFGAGEYRPGTPVGDALIAHEVAHVVQQSSGVASGVLTKGDEEGEGLEADADRSAVQAVLTLWSGGRQQVGQVSQQAWPQLRSGLRLSRCSRNQAPNPTGVHYDEGSTSFGSASPGSPLADTVPNITRDESATQEDVTSHLASMNAGGVYIFFGHSASERAGGPPVGINPSSGHTVRGDAIRDSLRRDHNPPTMVVLTACGSASLLDSVREGGVPIAVGLSEYTANVVAAGTVHRFMEQLQAGRTFAEAKEAADAVAARNIGGMPGEVVIRYGDGYNSRMTLDAARQRHQSEVGSQ